MTTENATFNGNPLPPMSDKTLITPNRDEATLTIERTFAAPRDLVFAVYTEPRHLQQWFAPKPWTLDVCNVDLRVGGVWQYKMQGPDGEASWGKAIYNDIAPTERLGYVDSFTDAEGNINEELPRFNVAITFTEHDGQTTVSSRSQLASAEEIDALMDMGMAYGIRMTWDVLDEYLQSVKNTAADTSSGDSSSGASSTSSTFMLTAEPNTHEITMTRVLNAPRDLVFRVYTDPATVPQWWGPSNLTTDVDVMDVRPGGQWRYVQNDPQGESYGFHGVYHSITPNERVVYTFEFEGMPGHVLLETVTFEDQGGKTRIVDHSVFQSVAARDGMIASGMEGGSRELFDRLAAIVENQ